MHNNTETYKKTAGAGLFFSILFFIITLYISFYIYFSKYFTHYIIEELLLKILKKDPSMIVFKVINVGFIIGSMAMFSPSNPTKDKENKNLYGGLTIIFCLFFIITPFFEKQNEFWILLNIFLFIGIVFTAIEYRKRAIDDLYKDRQEIDERQWDQSREKIETDVSVNIAYKYKFKGKTLISWINIINPFRALLVGGTPGSGKTFAIIEEFMRQLTKKGFTGVIYDFKFPTLTIKQWNYLNWYADSYTIPPKFYFLNFDDPSYSHRTNPINEDLMISVDDARESTFVLMNNLNKTWVQKEGDFFTDSAMVYTAMLMWYSRLLVKKYDFNVCSIPHVVALSAFESTELLFLILNKYIELRSFMKPFSEALEKGALEQLAGQVASAGIALSKIASPEIFYVLSGEDFDLELNNPLSPKILCLGNNPDRQQTYRAPIGLILSRLTRSLNKQKKEKSFFVMDEFPTIFLGEIANFIATVRSNKSAVLLGFQTIAQIVTNYGKEKADEVLKVAGSRIVGQLLDDDAELISKNLGKQKVVRNSNSISADSQISTTQNISMEDVVPIEAITQFSQGTFCGFTADTFANKETKKAFYGDVQVPMDFKENEEKIPLPEIYSFITKEELETKILEFKLKHQERIIKIKIYITTKSFIAWTSLFEETVTTRVFNEYVVNEIQEQSIEFKEFSLIVDIKKRLKDYIEKQKQNSEKQINLSKSSPEEKKIIMDEFLNRKITSNQSDEFLNDWIEQGIKDKAKEIYLQDYYYSIYNDVYRIIMLEVENLNIIQELIDNADIKTLRALLKTFKKVSQSENINDDLIKTTFLNFTIKIEKGMDDIRNGL
jgi:Ca2+/Na+ antiporter